MLWKNLGFEITDRMDIEELHSRDKTRKNNFTRFKFSNPKKTLTLNMMLLQILVITNTLLMSWVIYKYAPKNCVKKMVY